MAPKVPEICWAPRKEREERKGKNERSRKNEGSGKGRKRREKAEDMTEDAKTMLRIKNLKERK